MVGDAELGKVEDEIDITKGKLVDDKVLPDKLNP
jgi:hypothetical protein